MSFTSWFIIIILSCVVIALVLRWLDRRNSVKMVSRHDGEKEEARKKSYFRREVVQAKVSALFPDHDSAEILRLLELVPAFGEVERMQLNVLKLSEGDLEKLRHYTNVAASGRDWTEIIDLAEYPESSKVPPTEIDKVPYDQLMGRIRRDARQYLNWLKSK